MRTKAHAHQYPHPDGRGLFTAIVVALQFLGSFVRFGSLSIKLVLVPIVVDTALYGAGAWLSFVFELMVLLRVARLRFWSSTPSTRS